MTTAIELPFQEIIDRRIVLNEQIQRLRHANQVDGDTTTSWELHEAEGELDRLENHLAEFAAIAIRIALSKTPEMFANALEGSSTLTAIFTRLERLGQKHERLAKDVAEIEDDIIKGES